MKKLLTLGLAAFAVLSLTGCTSTQPTEEDAVAPVAEEAMTGVVETPVVDQAMTGAEQAPVVDQATTGVVEQTPAAE